MKRGKPSGRWLGALITACPLLAAAWLLAYTLLRLPFLEPLGGWNYAGPLALILAVGVLGRAWHGEEYVRPTSTSRL
ncbi:cell division protein CrgA [Paractinoplanes durhamensis]|uniref:Uncharacterized protein n=1 Tax=Paractinoplanes durhamensis TaxID=113563 RepID=A0ABQ3Z6Y7_9ACTN|nr:cell division protein CrgA [Actinoplanes durhamensis]GIE05591.1 hypothetical protein Adu01nite_69410 [Actinoplanes durhamensis]